MVNTVSSFMMKTKRAFIGLVLLCYLSSFTACATQQSLYNRQPESQTENITSVRVATFNMHHANPPAQPGTIDVEAIANVIKKIDADLVAFQEVDVYTARSGLGLNQAKKLAQLTNMYFFFSKSIDYQSGSYGNAVLSKFPIVDSVAYHLPIDEQIGGELRSVATITVKLPEGHEIVFASTHLGYQSKINRLMQIEQIKKAFINKGKPVILAGDMNAGPDSEAMKELEEIFWLPCGENCAPSYPASNPTKKIDFILLGSKKPWKKISYGVYSMASEVSDHLPVVAEFQLVKIK